MRNRESEKWQVLGTLGAGGAVTDKWAVSEPWLCAAQPLWAPCVPLLCPARLCPPREGLSAVSLTPGVAAEGSRAGLEGPWAVAGLCSPGGAGQERSGSCGCGPRCSHEVNNDDLWHPCSFAVWVFSLWLYQELVESVIGSQGSLRRQGLGIFLDGRKRKQRKNIWVKLKNNSAVKVHLLGSLG